MKSRPVVPQHYGWIETVLDKEHMDFLWKRIDIAKKERSSSQKSVLIGNISHSFELQDDEDDYFFNKVMWPHVDMYRKMYHGKDPIQCPVNAEIELYIQSFWVNYQYKHEFNPYHFHGGEYSWVVWMKIPTEWREQHKLPFLEGIKEDDRKVSNFEFQYIDMFGGMQNYGYRLDKSMEGRMLFFPAKLMHTVYPFFENDEDRISISGNLWYRPVQSY